MKHWPWFFLLVCGWLLAAELPTWEFPEGLAQWTRQRQLNAVAEEDSARLDLLGRDSSLGIEGVSLSTAEIGGFAIEYRAEGFDTATNGQLFYATAQEPQFGEARQFKVGSLVTDGEWHTINVLADGAWRSAGTVTALRLDLVDQFPGTLWIRSITALPGERTRAELRGIPVQVPVEIIGVEHPTILNVYDPRAPHFESPIVAPANGGFSHLGTCYLRREFELARPPLEAQLVCSCDDMVEELWLNDELLEHNWSNYWKVSDAVPIAPERLLAGRNVLCVKYQNTGGLGGLMADLQINDADGFHTITMKGARGLYGVEPPKDWTSLEKNCDWPLAETRPGAPNPPWVFCPPYTTIEEVTKSVEAVAIQVSDSLELTAVLRVVPELSDDEVLYAQIYNARGKLLAYSSGTTGELNALSQEDGALRVHFEFPELWLRYGGPVRLQCRIGVYGRIVQGNAEAWKELPERPLPGKPVSLRVERAPGGPRPVLNGKPFFFNLLTVERRQIPTGMEGANSPCNIITTRAGGWLSGDWWIGPRDYDFSGIDRQLTQCVEQYPDSWLGLFIWCHPGRWYAEMYPERLSIQEDGTPLLKGQSSATTAFSNEAYREDAEHAVRALVAHCEKYFGSRMVLYNLQGGVTYEWQGWNSHTELFADYAEQSAQDFREYARRHGREVHGVPTRAEREAGLPGGIFHDPERDWAAILYSRFYSESIAELIDRLAKITREETHGDKLVGAYYGYHQEFANLGYCVNDGGHNALAQLLASPNLDFFLSPIDYRHRSIGAPTSDMKPFAAIREAGKLSILEDDSRTNLIAPTIFDQTVNLEQTLAVFMRNHGVFIARGTPLNHLPLVGGEELNAPEIRALFEHSLRLGQMVTEDNVSPKAEVAAVLDEEALALLVSTLKRNYVPDPTRYHYDTKTGELQDVVRGVQPLTGELLGDQSVPFAQCGASVDWLMLQNPQTLAGYKLVIFLGTFADTPQLREALAVVRENDATALFVYGVGFMGAKGVDVARMSELLGIQLAEVPGASLQVRLADGRRVGMDCAVQPRFAVVDEEAEPLAYYAVDGAIAAARKGKSIFYGGTALDAQFVRETARAAGVHVFLETDDNFCAGGRVLCIHADSTGEKVVRLPCRTDAVDAYTGEVLGQNCDALTFPMKAFETKVIVLGDQEEILARLDFK
ncbi:MAG: beta-galactosidase [Victivallales bacterium]|nr:beta-galactosidase [Victivallales bacterium]